MEQYIPKSTLVAEIWKRRNKHFNFGGSPSSEYCHEDDEILGIINTLEVKEVDLEKEICIFFSKNPIPYEHIADWPLLKNCAIHFLELGLKARKK